VLGAPRTRVLHPRREAPIRKATEPIKRRRRACPIPEEALAAGVIARGDAHSVVEVEALVLRGKAQLCGVRVGAVVA
jgi:hypothetical protein